MGSCGHHAMDSSSSFGGGLSHEEETGGGRCAGCGGTRTMISGMLYFSTVSEMFML